MPISKSFLIGFAERNLKSQYQESPESNDLALFQLIERALEVESNLLPPVEGLAELEVKDWEVWNNLVLNDPKALLQRASQLLNKSDLPKNPSQMKLWAGELVLGVLDDLGLNLA